MPTVTCQTSKVKSQSGFTLIELLAVIAIVAVLSTVVGANVLASRAQARDVRRKADISAIKSALELYYNEHGEYPIPSAGWATSNDREFAGGWRELSAALAPYISSVPIDPVNNAISPWGRGGLSYGYGSAEWHSCQAGQWYALVWGLENRNDPLIAASPGVQLCDSYTYNETDDGQITEGVSGT